MNQSIHYSSHRKPNHRTFITEYNESCKLRATPKSMKHHSTSTPPPLRKFCPQNDSVSHSLLGLTSVGWSSLRLSSRTAASVKLDSGSHVASSMGYPVHIVRYS